MKREEFNEEKRKKTKEKIENGALLFFAKYGYFGSKIADLAKYLNISVGLIYRHFESKDKMFLEILENYSLGTIQRMDELSNMPLTPKDKILELTASLKEKIFQNRQFACIFTIIENTSLIDGIDKKFKMWSEKPINTLKNIIIEGQKTNTIYEGNPFDMSVTYWGLISSICRDSLVENGFSKNYDFNLLNRMLIKGV